MLERKEFPHYETQTVIEPLHKPRAAGQAQRSQRIRIVHAVRRRDPARARVDSAGRGRAVRAVLAVAAARLDPRARAHAHGRRRRRCSASTYGPRVCPTIFRGAAAELLRAGNLLGALSLLYRGALVTLLHRDHVQLAGGDTESDCLVKTRERVPSNTYAYLARLLLAWQGAAYAHRMPARSDVEQLASEWPGIFGQAT